jgi:hypothetical protein
MNTRRTLFAALLVGATVLPSTASAQTATPGACERGTLRSGALSLICVPSAGWNGHLVVFAHGYVPVGLPLGFYNLTLPDGTELSDLRLNLTVQRFTASPVARAALQNYETNGNLRIPLVTLHTTADEVVPYWHELLYLTKVDLSERGRFIPLPAFRYGHCNFTRNEVLASFALAVGQP